LFIYMNISPPSLPTINKTKQKHRLGAKGSFLSR
jgi:hypothetical protein